MTKPEQAHTPDFLRSLAESIMVDFKLVTMEAVILLTVMALL